MSEEITKLGKHCKEFMVKEISDKLQESDTVIVTECLGMDVSMSIDLRNKLRPINVSYSIVKNSLGKIALKNTKNDQLIPFIKGTVGMATGIKDLIAASKVLAGAAKAFGKISIKGGTMEGRLISEAEIKELALLPSREALLARAFGGMKAPITGFVNGLQGIIRKFVYAINEIKAKKEGGSN